MVPPTTPWDALKITKEELKVLRIYENAIDKNIENYTGQPMDFILEELGERQVGFPDVPRQFVLDKLVHDYDQAGWDVSLRERGKKGGSKVKQYMCLTLSEKKIGYHEEV